MSGASIFRVVHNQIEHVLGVKPENGPKEQFSAVSRPMDRQSAAPSSMATHP